MLRIIKAGLLDSIQDLGRVGYGDLGFCSCGAMDTHSLEILNILLGNDRGEAAIEICIMGGEYEFMQDGFFAISGAFCNASLSGKSINTCRVYKANAGEILKVELLHGGMYCYLGICGGFALESIYDSKSSDLRLGIGGFEGRKLQNGDILSFAKQKQDLGNLKARFVKNWLQNSHSNVFRVILGPQDDSFTKKGMQSFLNTEYTITSRSNRMGLRLQGEAIEHVSSGDIASDGIAFGAVQVPGDGQPIILMADRQLSGGYAKIANVISEDLPRLAQSRYNSKIKFEVIDISEAQELLAKRDERTRRLQREFS